MVAPCLTSTVNVAESLVALPAVPVKVGFGLVEAEPLAGAVTATPVGAVRSILTTLVAVWIVSVLPTASTEKYLMV